MQGAVVGAHTFSDPVPRLPFVQPFAPGLVEGRSDVQVILGGFATSADPEKEVRRSSREGSSRDLRGGGLGGPGFLGGRAVCVCMCVFEKTRKGAMCAALVRKCSSVRFARIISKAFLVNKGRGQEGRRGRIAEGGNPSGAFVWS